MTIYERLAEMDREERAAAVGYSDASLLGLRGLDPAAAGAVAFRSWACPEYLAGVLGFTFECNEPRSFNAGRCAKCAAAFLRMQWPNTGKARKNERTE